MKMLDLLSMERKMKIRKILSQHRRDFTAIYECEHCEAEIEHYGYDDANFHQNVIPQMECKKCGKKAPSDYRALTTKHPEGFQV
jgi:transcription elongation factor Elf1